MVLALYSLCILWSGLGTEFGSGVLEWSGVESKFGVANGLFLSERTAKPHWDFDFGIYAKNMQPNCPFVTLF